MEEDPLYIETPAFDGSPYVDLPAARIVSLCSGIGGLDLSIRLAGKVLGFRPETLCYVEREFEAVKILARQMEEGRIDAAPVWSDLKTFQPVAERMRGQVDILTGGYPCQPFSAAGKRKGREDPRHLWPHIEDIIRAAEPVLCFFENVAFHLRLGFQEVCYGLGELGYEVEAGLYSTAEVGGSQVRSRLFIMAHSNKSIDANRQPRDAPDNRESGVSSLSEKRENLWDITGKLHSSLERFPPIPESDQWETNGRLFPVCKSDIWRIVDDAPDWVDKRIGASMERRLRLLGNAVVPACGAVAFIDLAAKLGLV